MKYSSKRMDIDRFDFRTNGEAVNYLFSKDGTLLKMQKYIILLLYGRRGPKIFQLSNGVC